MIRLEQINIVARDALLPVMDVARVAAGKRVGEPEMALLYATQGWRP